MGIITLKLNLGCDNGRRSCNGGESLLLSTIKPVHVHIELWFFISTKLTMVLALAQNKKQLDILDSMNAGEASSAYSGASLLISTNGFIIQLINS